MGWWDLHLCFFNLLPKSLAVPLKACKLIRSAAHYISKNMCQLTKSGPGRIKSREVEWERKKKKEVSKRMAILQPNQFSRWRGWGWGQESCLRDLFIKALILQIVLDLRPLVWQLFKRPQKKWHNLPSKLCLSHSPTPIS